MPNGSFADTTRRWESLLAACIANGGSLPDSEPFQLALSDILNEVREIKALQEDLDGRRQGTTQRLGEAVARGEEAARRLRGYVKARMGTRTEFLVQFGIAPIRSRSRSRKPPIDPPSSEDGGAPKE